MAPLIGEFATYFGVDGKSLLSEAYTRIAPSSSRPFANKYVWE